jgi:hypothetical protein
MNIKDYGEQLRACGSKAVAGSENTLWVKHARFAMQRQPVFALHVPSKEEIADVFRRSHAALLSFATKPSEEWVANSRLYLCTDPEYSIEKLAKGPRHDVRRGLSEFEIRFLDQTEVLRLGAQAYCETRARAGVSDGTPKAFAAEFGRPHPARRYLGAFKHERLAAFLLVTEVEDWISIGGYSANEFRTLCPNNALLYYAVHHYLAERKFRVVNYGLSSIQAVSNADGLERFKLKMGFESASVHRAFVVNPFLRPFANRVSWSLVNGMLKLSPHNLMLKKAEGALRMALRNYNQ